MPTNQPTVVFSMGLPAAGKSWWIENNLAGTHTVIDPDAIKETHPNFDPTNTQALHAWSQDVVEEIWSQALDMAEGNWVVDGTGTNAEKMVRRFNEAKEAGFRVELVFVKCTLATSLARNAARARNVPENVIRQKALDIHTSFALVAPHADRVVEIDND